MRSKVYIDTGRFRSKKEYEQVLIESSFIQCYVNIVELFYQITRPSSLHLLMWIVINMDDYNQVMLGKSNRSDFIYDSVKHNGRIYSDSTVSGAIAELKELSLITSMNVDGERQSKYMVNPDYFWKTRIQAERLEAIKGFTNQIKINKNE